MKVEDSNSKLVDVKGLLDALFEPGCKHPLGAANAITTKNPLYKDRAPSSI